MAFNMKKVFICFLGKSRACPDRTNYKNDDEMFFSHSELDLWRRFQHSFSLEGNGEAIG